MKFLTVTPFYRDRYYDANREFPLVIDFPDDEVPSPDWFPLDDRAEAASKKLAETMKLPAKKRQIAADSIPVEVVPPRPKVVPLDEQPIVNVKKAQPDTLAGIQGQSRMSDREPGRR